MGDPAGIGPEVIAKAWAVREAQGLSPFFVVGDSRAISAVWDGPVECISDPDEAVGIFDRALPCLQLDTKGEIVPGRPDTEGAECALNALEIGIGLAKSGAVAGLVTGPVGKTQLYTVGFTHPGQTEFIAERCGVSRTNAVMMLAGPSLRVVPITIHIPLRDVPDALSIDLIRTRAHVTAKGLARNFGIERPRIAVAGLNPHAGEQGNIGREEIEIIAPAVAPSGLPVIAIHCLPCSTGLAVRCALMATVMAPTSSATDAPRLHDSVRPRDRMGVLLKGRKRLHREVMEIRRFLARCTGNRH